MSGSSDDSKPLVSRFGLNPEEVYQAALEFYRKEGHNLHLSYEQKTRLSAFWKQVTYGGFSPEKASDVGLLNFVGKDRRSAWVKLGDLSKDSSQDGFCQVLLEACPNELEAVLSHAAQLKEQRLVEERQAREKAEKDEKERREKEERKRAEEEAARRKERAREEQQLAEENKTRQSENVSSSENQVVQSTENGSNSQPLNEASTSTIVQEELNGGDEMDGINDPDFKLWSRPDVAEFIQKVDTETVIVVGRGEAVTVRVPTHAGGTTLVFEFATETYDLGFGVSFEWPANEGGRTGSAIDVVLPSKRFNSHQQVIAGSHRYPGVGTYLLKFDNTFSMIRSKTLYYRVYYKA